MGSRDQHPLVERGRLARVGALAHRLVGHVVLVLAVLAVEQLGGDHDRGVAVEHGHVEGEHREVALGHRDHPGGLDEDLLAGRRAPHEAAAEHAVPEVELRS